MLTNNGWKTKQTQDAWVTVSNNKAAWHALCAAAHKRESLEDDDANTFMTELYRHALYMWLVTWHEWDPSDLMFVDVNVLLDMALEQTDNPDRHDNMPTQREDD